LPAACFFLQHARRFARPFVDHTHTQDAPYAEECGQILRHSRTHSATQTLHVAAARRLPSGGLRIAARRTPTPPCYFAAHTKRHHHQDVEHPFEWDVRVTKAVSNKCAPRRRSTRSTPKVSPSQNSPHKLRAHQPTRTIYSSTLHAPHNATRACSAVTARRSREGGEGVFARAHTLTFLGGARVVPRPSPVAGVSSKMSV
jgi:hypothetical protein